MPQIYDTETNRPIGTVTESQVRFLINQLEEESTEDRDYFIDAATIELLEQNGGDVALVALLRNALGSREGMEIRWAD